MAINHVRVSIKLEGAAALEAELDRLIAKAAAVPSANLDAASLPALGVAACVATGASRPVSRRSLLWPWFTHKK
jgi:hypothetical protein